MENSNIIGICIGIIASIALNLGKGIQKLKVDVLKNKLKALAKENRKDFSIWLTGVIITTTAAPMYSFAFKYSDTPSVISALGGVGLIAVLIFSKIVLKELINFKKILGIILIILGTIFLFMLSGETASKQSINYSNLNLIGFIAAIYFSFNFFVGKKYPKVSHICLALCAGSFLGSAMILADVALVYSNGSMTGQLGSPIVYMAMFSGNIAFVITQFALMRGDASVVIPVIHSVVIITSVTLEYIIFNSVLLTSQYFSLLIIIFGTFLITSKMKIIQEETTGIA